MRWVWAFALLSMTACGSGEAATAHYEAPPPPPPSGSIDAGVPDAEPELTLAPIVPRPDPLHVLFIGNSYTYVNDVPGLLEKISKTAGSGPIIETEALTSGGAALSGWSTDPEAAKRIAEGTWTHVVLQGQSLNFAPAQPAKVLGDMVVEAGAIPTWYVTWARAPESDEYTLSASGYASATEMQDFATYSYVQAAEQTQGSLLACVGEAFRQSLALHPQLALHQADYSHATMAGAYLAASTFYVALTGTPVPEGSFVPDGIAASDVTSLRAAALVGSNCSEVRTRGSVHPDYDSVDFGVAGAPIPALLKLENRGSSTGYVYAWELAAPFEWVGDAFPGGIANPSAPDLTFCKASGLFWEVPPSSACLMSFTFDASMTANSQITLKLVDDYRPGLVIPLSGTVGSTDRARLVLCEETGYLSCTTDASATFWKDEDVTLVVTNRGGLPTTSMTPNELPSPVVWANGAFPGGTGVGKPNRKPGWAEYRDPEKTYPYCGDVLAPGAQCIVTLAVDQLTSGNAAAKFAKATLELTYSDAVGPAAQKASRTVSKYIPPDPAP